jgi:Carboxypeptidase regulatory-like domain
MTAAALAVALLLQAPAAPRAAEPGTGVIRGRVIAADTGRPLKRATIRLQAESGPGIRSTASTNSLGLFEFGNVPPGQYLVVVSRAGYLQQQYGQRRPNERGVTVDIADRAIVDKIDVALPRGGVLAGRVSDERGEPYQGAEVIALAPRYLNGKRVYSPGGRATTDDIGQYRMAGVPPGAYLIVALSTETWRTDAKTQIGFGATYYPGVAFDAAQPVTIAPSQQHLDLDFTLRTVRPVTVSGQIRSETGPLPANSGASLMYSWGEGAFLFGARRASVGADGRFEIKDVTEGPYELSGTGGNMALKVGEADIDNLDLVRRIGSTVTGTIVTDEDTPPPFSNSGVRVNVLAPFGNVLPTVRVVGAESDWSFKLQNLGGPFLFRVLGLPPGWALGAVRLGARDITDAPWDVPTGGKEVDGLRIVLTQKISRVAGTIVDRDGKPTDDGVALVFADDDKLWIPGSRFVRTARPGKDGRFALSDMPAGAYRAIALEAVEDGQWDDPSFLEALRDQAVRFVLAEGGTAAISLKQVRK